MEIGLDIALVGYFFSECYRMHVSSFLRSVNGYVFHLLFWFQIDIRIVDIIRVSYRLLLLDPKVFSELWDWSAFYDLVQHVNCPQIETADPVFNDLLDIRWCVIQVLSVVMRTSDRIIANLGMGAEEAFMCLLRLVMPTLLWSSYLYKISLITLLSW